MEMSERVTLNIGKNGLDESMIAEIVTALKKHKQLRIKVLRSAAPERKDFEEITSRIRDIPGCIVEDVRGRVIALKKERTKKAR